MLACVHSYPAATTAKLEEQRPDWGNNGDGSRLSAPFCSARSSQQSVGARSGPTHLHLGIGASRIGMAARVGPEAVTEYWSSARLRSGSCEGAPRQGMDAPPLGGRGTRGVS